MGEIKATDGRPVLQAIANVMASVGAVDKRGKNQFHGYEYATAGDIMHALQRRMASEGLVITANQRKLELVANDSVMLVEFGFDVQHTSGDKLDETLAFSGMAGCKNKNGSFDDKAVNKCLVGAVKYFMLHLFKIPTGDYHDADADAEPPAPAPQSRQEPHQPPKAPPKAPAAVNGTHAAPPARTRAPLDERQGDDIPPGVGDPVVPLVDASGAVKSVRLTKALEWLQYYHADDTLSHADWWERYYQPNVEWLERQAPKVASEMAVRGG